MLIVSVYSEKVQK